MVGVLMSSCIRIWCGCQDCEPARNQQAHRVSQDRPKTDQCPRRRAVQRSYGLALTAGRPLRSTTSAFSPPRGLHLPAHEHLDHAPRYPLPGRYPQAQARLAHAGCPSPHLVTREGHQVEGLGEAGGGLLTQVPRSRVLASQSIAVDWARRGRGNTQGCAGTVLLRLAHALRVLGGT